MLKILRFLRSSRRRKWKRGKKEEGGNLKYVKKIALEVLRKKKKIFMPKQKS